jgi:hypothetical protein
VTVAIAGFASEYRLTYGCAADNGGDAAPPCPSVAISVSRRTSSGTSADALDSSSSGAGSASHEYWSSTVYGVSRRTWSQWSIAPVGHGGTQALQLLQIENSTT